jgi:hypothetical protein
MESGWGGEVRRTSWGELARTGALPEAGLPGEVFAASVRASGREAASAEVAAAGAARLQDVEVRAGLGSLAFAARALLHARLRLACEAAARGLHTAEGFGLVDWLGLRCPDLDAATVRDLARLAQAGGEDVHAPLLTGVLGAGMPVARAARMHRALARVRAALTPGEYADAVTLLTDAGCNPVFQEQDIERIIAELLRRCLPEKEHEARRTAAHELRDVHESSLADGTIKRIILTFGEDADYQAVRAVLTCPLAAPASKEEREATGEGDRRTPGARRYDAFMTVFRRGIAGSQGQPTTPRAMLVVTLDHETLTRSLAGSGGTRPGCGATLDGAPVSAESIRRLACEADLIPMVLGSSGEVLDQGRRRRLVTPAQRVRLAVRDRGCTIPGCTVPATWCDAHHVIPWSHGGRSDLSNYALLCPRHHTWVHDRGHTATITTAGVTWHLI